MENEVNVLAVPEIHPNFNCNNGTEFDCNIRLMKLLKFWL